jgi:hypothetical protein
MYVCMYCIPCYVSSDENGLEIEARKSTTGYHVTNEKARSLHEVDRYTKTKKKLNSSDRRLSAKLVQTFADRGCCVVSARDPHGR